MTDEIPDKAARRLSFGAVADRYDSVRPSYPDDGVAWAVGRGPRTVVDLGAGTGLLSRVLHGLGHVVVPVEPDPGMRARFDAATPGVRAVAGSAEEIPLPDASVDAVVAGQSYHWFDRDKAHAEVARVLRPGGVFAPMWNTGDDSAGWVRELWSVTHTPPVGPDQNPLDEHDFGRWFGPVEHASFRHDKPHTVDSLVELIRSTSAYLVGSPEQQHAMEDAAREILAGFAPGEIAHLPYVLHVYRAYRTNDVG